MKKLFEKMKKSELPNRLVGVLICLVTALSVNAEAASQPDDLIADRPGFSTGTHSVTPGKFYLEIGYQYSFNTEKNLHNYSDIPDLNLRIGIANKLELFVMWDGWSISHYKGIDGIGSGNAIEAGLPGLGAKYQLVRADDYNITLLGMLEGTDANNSYSVDPALALAWDYELSGRFELFGLVQGGYEANPGNNDFLTLFAMGLGFEINDRMETFAEYYNIAYPGTGKLQNGSEFGIMYLLNSDTQLDIYGGYGFGREMDHYMGLGISRRF